ncbi:MAG TPA: GNAT family N-acetyltransferase [Hyphomonadaceae bacterium]|nr:GNAT family N-acetyltransferase [Hyphomonadaceae bacterium]
MQLTIETRRLQLRPFCASDARRIAFLAGDYEVAKMCGRVPHPYSLQTAIDWVATHEAQRASRAEFAFAVVLERDGLIGSCGVTHLKDAPERVWEIGYWLGAPYWGLGYATEAAEALMAWARDQLGATSFCAGHFADNPASGHVLRKLGFAHTHSEMLFGLARQTRARGERYVWPEGLADARLLGLHGAHPPH